jgi:hypothetical protein
VCTTVSHPTLKSQVHTEKLNLDIYDKQKVCKLINCTPDITKKVKKLCNQRINLKHSDRWWQPQQTANISISWSNAFRHKRCHLPLTCNPVVTTSSDESLASYLPPPCIFPPQLWCNGGWVVRKQMPCSTHTSFVSHSHLQTHTANMATHIVHSRWWSKHNHLIVVSVHALQQRLSLLCSMTVYAYSEQSVIQAMHDKHLYQLLGEITNMGNNLVLKLPSYAALVLHNSKMSILPTMLIFASQL